MEIIKIDEQLIFKTETRGEIAIPEYPSNGDAANAILLSMLDVTSLNLELKIICEVVKADSKMSACIGMLPYYCKYYSEKEGIEYRKLKDETYKMIFDAKMGGMLN